MAEGTCSEDGCKRPAYCRGICQRHYDRWCRVRDRTCPVVGCSDQIVPSLTLCRKHYNEWKRTQPIQSCSIDECGRPRHARGWCSMHWKVWRTHGDPLWMPTPRLPSKCAVRSCQREARTAGYCNPHYLRLNRHGDAEYVKPPRPRCQIENCERPAHIKGWCRAHYARWKRWGDPMGKRAMNGVWRTDRDGYRRASMGGKDVMEHRVVMEEMLGRPLTKDESVHHKNGVRDDNRPCNLELWSKYQPSGERVEDKVAWAKEILARYGSDFTQPCLGFDE